MAGNKHKSKQHMSNPIDINIRLAEEYFRQNNFAEAITSLNKAIAVQPTNLLIQNHLAVALIYVGQELEAIKILEHICAQNQNLPDVLNNLGNLYTKQARNEEALILFKRAIRVKPSFADAHNNIASVFKNLGQYSEVEQALEKCLKYAPRHLLALVNLGKLQVKKGNNQLAKGYLEKALKVDPNCLTALSELAEVYRELGDIGAAIAMLNKLFCLDPTHVDGHFLRGFIFQLQRDYSQALKHYKLADQGDAIPSAAILANMTYCYAQNLAWDLMEPLVVRLEKAIDTGNYTNEIQPFAAGTMIASLKEQQKIAERWCLKLTAAKTEHTFEFQEHHSEKIRIGYISPNFSKHPVGFLLNKLLARHDREKFEVFGFATKCHDDPYFTLISESVDHMIRLDKLSSLAAAKAIHAHKIDILIDLDGHTGEDSMGILAYQPAKSQCCWLGSMGTIGAKFIQYQISDPQLIPDKFTEFYTENILRLPAFYAIDEFPKYTGEAPKRAAYGLPADAFVFCYHGQPYRIDRPAFTAWMNILQAVPNSVLWLSTNIDEQKYNLCNYAKRLNVDPRRLVFSKPFNLSDKYAHCLSDLWLDTFRYSAGTAGMLCLFGGLPLLTLTGATPQNRIATASLAAAGLPELITANAEDYIKKAVLLATDRDYYDSVKLKIKHSQQYSDLFNPGKFIKQLEAGYQKIHENWQNKVQTKVVTV